jgi:uncharacterized membrane protein YqjE
MAASGAALIRGEVRLARLELAQAVETIGRAAVLVAAGAVLALLGSLSMVVALVLLAGEQWIPRLYWLAALLLMMVTGAVAALFASRGRALLAPSRLVPDQTITTVKENTTWLKHQLTSAAKSR